MHICIYHKTGFLLPISQFFQFCPISNLSQLFLYSSNSICTWYRVILLLLAPLVLFQNHFNSKGKEIPDWVLLKDNFPTSINLRLSYRYKMNTCQFFFDILIRKQVWYQNRFKWGFDLQRFIFSAGQNLFALPWTE